VEFQDIQKVLSQAPNNNDHYLSVSCGSIYLQDRVYNLSTVE